MTDLARLRDPFAPDDVEWRAQSVGETNGKPWIRVLAYITNRAIIERFDAVVGPAHWRNEYRPGPAGGVVCGLSIRVTYSDGATEWVTKWDGAENTDVEPVKGGLSSAMKRAAVQWGVGAYLYDLDEGWGRVHDGGRFSAKRKGGDGWFKWDPPELPKWAMPAPPALTPATLAMLEQLLAGVGDAKLVNMIRRKLAAGMTEHAAREAVKFLESRQPAATA